MMEGSPKTNVILICGSFTSANFYVMLSVIRSLGNVHIHAISANNESKIKLPQYDDVTYYHVHNWRKELLSRIERFHCKFFVKAFFVLFNRTTGIYDNYCTSVYERRIYRKCLSIIDVFNVESVFSVCLRFYTHRIAMKLKNKTGIKWYQFWADPYSNRKGYGRIWTRGAERVEQHFFESATKFYALPEVFVSNKLINKYKDKLITFEIPYLVNRAVETTTKDIVFAGGFIKKVREPKPVLDILLSVCDKIDKDIRFHFYTNKKDDYDKYQIESNGKIIFHEYVSHDELYSILSKSFMLINIGNAGSIQMPSKTVEYVSFRKPLLFFYKDKNDASLRYLADYPDICRINIEDDFNENILKLIDYFGEYHNVITYKELLKTKCYFESTPDYVRQQLISLTDK